MFTEIGALLRVDYKNNNTDRTATQAIVGRINLTLQLQKALTQADIEVVNKMDLCIICLTEKGLSGLESICFSDPENSTRDIADPQSHV